MENDDDSYEILIKFNLKQLKKMIESSEYITTYNNSNNKHLCFFHNLNYYYYTIYMLYISILFYYD
jgi:hypothetical protein